MASSFASPLIIWGLLFIGASAFPSPAHSLTCTSQKFSNSNLYSQCVDLPVLSSYLHWTYDSSNSSLSIAFVASPAKSGGWISWSINPTGTGMAGAQAFIAFESAGAMTIKTFNISSYSDIVPSKLSFDVWDTSAEKVDGAMRIFAKMKVPEKQTTVNQVWQVGPSVTGGTPSKHDFSAANLNSKGSLILTGGEGQAVATSGNADSEIKNRNIHGILNAVSWGLLFPIGIMMARYLRPHSSLEPVWFYLHVSCQISAYAIGVAGWATGLKLGSESQGIVYSAHRNIGIALFSFATLQMFALLLRPKKGHKLRIFWNIYHHVVGYAILALGIVNVFKGFDILRPEQKWKMTYVVVLCVLGGTALLLEIITWIVLLRRKSNETTMHYDGYNNGQSRQQPLAN